MKLRLKQITGAPLFRQEEKTAPKHPAGSNHSCSSIAAMQQTQEADMQATTIFRCGTCHSGIGIPLPSLTLLAKTNRPDWQVVSDFSALFQRRQTENMKMPALPPPCIPLV
ncbi:hypothetical protein [Pseudochrobactrum sp. HB0163]|uniref:hypothetical protein n=1 Tax=Pseudochrobactrum sp. HB0163 TaxID=3450708 RepID=UPI003F6E421C